MSAKNENGACSPPEVTRQDKIAKGQQAEKSGQDKKPDPPPEKPDASSSQTGQSQLDSGESKRDDKRPITLQDLIDLTNESP